MSAASRWRGQASCPPGAASWMCTPQLWRPRCGLSFFGDEVDALGIFDPGTQRRTANVEKAVLLPAAETLLHLAPGGLVSLLKAAGPALRRRRPRTAWRNWRPPSGRTGRPWRRGAPSSGRPVSSPNLSGACHRSGLSPPYDACVLFSESNRVGGTGQDLAVAAGGGRQDPAGQGGWMGPAGRCPAPMSSCAAGWRTSPSPIWTPSPCPLIRRPPGVCCP